MKFTSNPDQTGEIGMVPPEWQKIYGSKWMFTADQWKIVSRVVTKAMFSAGPPNESDNVLPPGSDPATAYRPPPMVVPAAAMLVNALILDPYHIYGSVPWASNIRWANYACIATWFHWLSDEGRQMFCTDVKTGNVNRWLAAVRDIAMANCPKAVWGDAGYFSAHLIMEIDARPFVDFADQVWQEARVGTPFAKSDQSSFMGGIPTLPIDLLCQPFPQCMIEGLFGTGSMPAEVNPVSGRVEYKQESVYQGTPDGVDPKTGTPTPYNWFLGPVVALAGGGAMYGLATLLGAGRLVKIAASGAGVAAGAVIGGKI
jgi:hypothetical protein